MQISSALRDAAARLLSPEAARAPGTPRWTTKNFAGISPGDAKRRFRLTDGYLPARVVRTRRRIARALTGGAESIRDRRVDAVQPQARLLQPLRELSDRGPVVVVEMGSRRKQLDRLEAVAGDLGQVLTAQSLLVIEVCRYAEVHGL